MKIISATFLFLYLLTLTYNVDAADTYTVIDYKNGQILLCADQKCGMVIQHAELNESAKYGNNFDAYEFPDSWSAEKKKAANALNLDHKWISGGAYIEANGIKFPVGIKEALLATRYLAEKKLNRKVDQPGLKEEAAIDESINQIKSAIIDVSAKELAAVKDSPDLKKKSMSTETDYDKILSSVNATTNASSTLMVALINNNPTVYLISSTGFVASNNAEGKAVGDTTTIKTSAGNLFCRGMAQDNQWPVTGKVAKIDFNFAPTTLFQYGNDGTTTTAIIDTNTTDNVCNYSADEIFKSNLDTTTR